MATATEEPQTTDQPEAPPADPDGKALFDKAAYDTPELQIAKIDGQPIDRILLKIAGSIWLDRSDPADCALWRRLAFGRDVTLQVEGRCSLTGAKGVTDREGDLDVVAGVKTIKVHTVYVSSADGLDEQAAA